MPRGGAIVYDTFAQAPAGKRLRQVPHNKTGRRIAVVVLLVMRHVFRRYSEPQTLHCSETGDGAMVVVDGKRAALTAAGGKPCLRATLCSRWP
jgi:hypothetical protein